MPNLLIVVFLFLLGQIGFDKPPGKKILCINKPFFGYFLIMIQEEILLDVDTRRARTHIHMFNIIYIYIYIYHIYF